MEDSSQKPTVQQKVKIYATPLNVIIPVVNVYFVLLRSQFKRQAAITSETKKHRNDVRV
jgi:hypothetical protein